MSIEQLRNADPLDKYNSRDVSAQFESIYKAIDLKRRGQPCQARKQPLDKKQYEPVLPANSDIAEKKPQQKAKATSKKVIGRPPLKKAEKRNYKITISLI